MHYLAEAFQAEDFETHVSYLKRAIFLWPHNWDAQSAYVVALLDSISIEDVQTIEEEGYTKWQSYDARERQSSQAQSYLRFKKVVADYLVHQGFLSMAQAHLEALLEMDSDDMYGARYSLMVVYCMRYDWEQSRALMWDDLWQGDTELHMLVPYLFTAVMTYHFQEALESYHTLIAMNPHVPAFLQAVHNPQDLHQWFQQRLAMDERLDYPDESNEALVIVMGHLSYMLLNCPYLIRWLQEVYPQVRKSDSHQTQGKIIAFQAHDQDTDVTEDSPLEGIKGGPLSALREVGLVTLEDFAEVTEAEVGAIKGVGPSTIQLLKDNGVTFKE